MEPDLVLEVPDTPERLAQLANESSCSPSQKENFNAEVDPSSTSQNIRHLLLRNSCHPLPKDIGERGVSIRSSTLNDTKLLSSKGKLAQLMSETLDKGRTRIGVGQSGVSTDRLEGTDWNHDTLTVPNGAICEDAKRKRGKGLLAERGKGLLDESSELPRSSGSNALLGIGSSLPAISVGRLRSQIGTSISDKDNVVLQDDTHADMQFRNKGKEVDLSTGSHSESHQELASAIHTDVPHRPRGLRRLVRNGCISPYNIARTSTVSEVQCQNGMTSDGQKFSSFARISDQDKLKGIDILEDLQPKNNCRNLVRNGCISLNNSAEGLTVRHPIEDELEEMKFRGVPKPNGTSHKIHNVSPDSKDRGDNGKNGKGKAIADAFTLTNGQHGKANLPLGRPCREAGEGAIYGDRESHILGFEDLGWRRTHNWTEKESTASSSENVSIRGREEASGHRSDQCNEVATGTDLESRRKKNTERKRKYGTGNSNGESSSSVFDVAEVSYLGTSWRPSKSRSTRTRNPRQRGIVLGAVIEVDELHSPEARSSNLQEQSHNVFDNCNARARQVESDELLAQQLQEQLYSESPVIRDRDESDAAIAWSIQQEENARRASLASGQTRHSRRERLIARLHSQRSHRNYLSRSANNAQYGSSTRTTRLMRDVDFPQMDINMRFDLLEELEAGMNNANRIAFSNILHIQRDFNENDYETLLALDDNNHQHTGATENQINNLPQSVVQTVNVEEPCAVCLEKPSVGDIVRHLPCLHKFHKDCIDQWLRRKTSCPVCKNGIT